MIEMQLRGTPGEERSGFRLANYLNQIVAERDACGHALRGDRFGELAQCRLGGRGGADRHSNATRHFVGVETALVQGGATGQAEAERQERVVTRGESREPRLVVHAVVLEAHRAIGSQHQAGALSHEERLVHECAGVLANFDVLWTEGVGIGLPKGVVDDEVRRLYVTRAVTRR
jgi:hypothetical protein